MRCRGDGASFWLAMSRSSRARSSRISGARPVRRTRRRRRAVRRAPSDRESVRVSSTPCAPSNVCWSIRMLVRSIDHRGSGASSERGARARGIPHHAVLIPSSLLPSWNRCSYRFVKPRYRASSAVEPEQCVRSVDKRAFENCAASPCWLGACIRSLEARDRLLLHNVLR